MSVIAKRSPSAVMPAILFALMGALVGWGFVSAASALVMRVEGTVVEAQHTGKSPMIVVDTGRGTTRVAADPDFLGACVKGTRLVKPSFGYAYTCEGEASGSMWLAYLGLFVATAAFAVWCSGVWIALRTWRARR